MLDGLKDSKILILGGTGLFGKHLLKKWEEYNSTEELNMSITMTTRNKERALAENTMLDRKNIQLMEIDFRRRYVIEGNFDYIMHMANASAQETYEGMKQGTKYDILANSTQCVNDLLYKGETKRVIFTSSGVAYGINNTYKESDIVKVNHLSPESTLTFGKLNAEYNLNRVCEETNVELVIARCFSVVSEYIPMELHYAIGNFIKNAIEEEDILIKSDGKDIRSFQYLDETVEWLTKLLIMKDPPRIINVGSKDEITIRDLARLVKRTMKSNSNIKILNQEPPKDNERRNYYVPNLDKADSLGLSNETSLEEALTRIYKFLK